MTEPFKPSPQKKLLGISGHWLVENILSLLLAVVLVFMIRSSVVEAFRIPSGSMIPTLFVGDHIFVNKFAYGLKVPFSDWITDRPVYVYRRDPPKRGDIIVFIYPKEPKLYFIKRVVGTPGDTVELRNKALYVNNTLIARTLLSSDQSDKIFRQLDDPNYAKSSVEIYSEHLGDGDHFRMINRDTYTTGDNFGPQQVPPDRLFVMGDNQDLSNDSRFWGWVPMDNVKGKAMVIWMSFAPDFKNWHFTFHPERIGTLLR